MLYQMFLISVKVSSPLCCLESTPPQRIWRRIRSTFPPRVIRSETPDSRVLQPDTWWGARTQLVVENSSKPELLCAGRHYSPTSLLGNSLLLLQCCSACGIRTLQCFHIAHVKEEKWPAAPPGEGIRYHGSLCGSMFSLTPCVLYVSHLGTKVWSGDVPWVCLSNESLFVDQILQCVAPKGPLACSRTYFFGTTHSPYLGELLLYAYFILINFSAHL